MVERICPRCGSQNLKSSLLLSGQEMVISMNFGVKNNELFLCKKCGYFGPVFKKEKIAKKATRTLVSNIFAKPKHAQLKIQQTAFMIIFLTIFFSMIGILFMSVWMSGLRSNVNILNENRAMVMSQFIYKSSEFSCAEGNCIDADRALFLNETKYKGLWPVSYIKIIKVYPKIQGEYDKKCNIGTYPNCGLFDYEFKKGEESCQGSFVALCRVETTAMGSYKKCELAKFCVGYQIK